MKYWIGYLVAAIFAVIASALTTFAAEHVVLMDMVYPYMTRMIISTMADWSGGGSAVWQNFLLWSIILGVLFIAAMVVFRWNPIRWLGWILAAVSFFSMMHTGLYELNAYTSPLADDMGLTVSDYTVSELHDATVYFRDRANELATRVPRNSRGNVDFGSFKELAVQAGEGFWVMTYEEAISVFAGSTVPVKEQTWFTDDGDSGITVPLTGEACVNPDVPEISMPFAMCKEMAHRMCIYSDIDAIFAAFLAASHNPSENFQYSAYLMAYYYCYESLADIPTSTAQACAQQTEAGVNQQMAKDLAACRKFYSKSENTATHIQVKDDILDSENAVITFSSYSTATDLFASWYIQEFIVPTHEEEEQPFNPYDPSQVDLTGIVNAPVATS